MESKPVVENTRVSNADAKESHSLDEFFDAHIAAEFADRDVDATMATMAPEPYVHCIPTLTGGVGGQGVRRFYSEHFVNQIPKDAGVTPISRTIGKDQVVDEIIVSFTHDTQWDFALPGIPPTGRLVELPTVVVMKIENGKVAHEHVWWDQASLLVQVGLLDPAKLPVAGVEQARKLLSVARGQESTNRQEATKKKELPMFNTQAIGEIASAIKYHPSPKRYYFDVTLGSILLSGEDTGGAYSLLELYVAPGKGVGRHIHTREDEAFFVISGELEATIGDDVFVLKAGETLIAPRDIPHALRNPGKVPNHYLTMFSPSGFEGFLKAISVAAPEGAAAPTEPPPSPIENVVEVLGDYGIQFA